MVRFSFGFFETKAGAKREARLRMKASPKQIWTVKRVTDKGWKPYEWKVWRKK
jgi:hypothetical protein